MGRRPPPVLAAGGPAGGGGGGCTFGGCSGEEVCRQKPTSSYQNALDGVCVSQWVLPLEGIPM